MQRLEAAFSRTAIISGVGFSSASTSGSDTVDVDIVLADLHRQRLGVPDYGGFGGNVVDS